MHSSDRLVEKLLMSVVHDLRQPLGTIETSAYLLNRIFHDVDGPAKHHLLTIEQQVDQAARILRDAARELCRLNNQPRETEIRDFTKSQTAAVT